MLTLKKKKNAFFSFARSPRILGVFQDFFFKEILFLFRKRVVWSKNAKSTSAKSKIWFENRDLENHRYFTLFCYEMLPNRGQKGWILMSNSSYSCYKCFHNHSETFLQHFYTWKQCVSCDLKCFEKMLQKCVNAGRANFKRKGPRALIGWTAGHFWEVEKTNLGWALT